LLGRAGLKLPNPTEFESNMTEVQHKISGVVDHYISLFPVEYATFAQAMKVKRSDLKNDLAEIKHNDMVQRKLSEVPELLWSLLMKMLTDEEMEYYRSIKGQNWLMRKYPVFCSPERI
jgi:hypothetical protein